MLDKSRLPNAVAPEDDRADRELQLRVLAGGLTALGLVSSLFACVKALPGDPFPLSVVAGWTSVRALTWRIKSPKTEFALQTGSALMWLVLSVWLVSISAYGVERRMALNSSGFAFSGTLLYRMNTLRAWRQDS